MGGSTIEKRLRILVTRPEKDAAELAETLRNKNFEVMIEPMLNIMPKPGAKPKLLAELLRKPQAVLITSANGIRALAEMTAERDIRIFTVGEASGMAAESLGFTRVSSADGDVLALQECVLAGCAPEKGFLLHIAGSEMAGDLQGALEYKGFEVKRVVCYVAEPAGKFSEELQQALINCELDMALFYSPRTARIFHQIAKGKKLDYLLKNVEMICLSNAIAAEFPWRNVHVAQKPKTDALLRLIEDLKNDNTA